ncbi:MAG: DUF1223 domain-containing protein [Xanthobacteraceae bacterium]|nr:DUF1223 domain-containing protein [Xanthobacteraceae bacterium]
MVRLRFAPPIALGLALLAGSQVQAEPRAVIELFTSQGCSSCPAADKLMGEYARDPSVIVMSLAVDYWDYLGWKDTLAMSGHSNRQRAYAKARGDRQVYTPQVVIDGAVHALGSDKAAIERAIRQVRDQGAGEQGAPLALPVKLERTSDKLIVTVSAGKDEKGQAEVWLCPITGVVPVTISKGENSGNTITYSNVVRRWIKLGDWTGKAETYSVPLADFQNDTIDSVAVLVQHGFASSPKLMLGAAQIGLKK